MKKISLILTLILIFLAPAMAAAEESTPPRIRIGSKNDIETAILGEALAILARDSGAEAESGVVTAGSGLIFTAIQSGEVDAYVEYTGTLISGTLASLNLRDLAALRAALRERGLMMTEPIGFNNTYALAVTRATAERLNLRTTSDLREHPDLSVGVSSEWFGRPDGWPSLKASYGLTQTNVTPITEHRLLYQAAISGQADVIEVYTTEAAIKLNDMVILEDDRGFFPEYEAFVLYRAELNETAPDVVAAWKRLAGTLDEQAVTALNAQVESGRATPAAAAAQFIDDTFSIKTTAVESTLASRLIQTTGEHLLLVLASMAMGIAVAIPLGILAAGNATLGKVIINGVSIIQTIPALALLVFLIPLPGFGLGAWTAIFALFLYSLLPMVRNTHAGLVGIARPIRESAEALGLTTVQRLVWIELPLALPLILAGIKTSAVITVGFATLGAFIGAGGYGQPILTGLYFDNTQLLREGAISAAVMALVVQFGLDALSRMVIPRGMAGR